MLFAGSTYSGTSDGLVYAGFVPLNAFPVTVTLLL